MTLVWIDKLNKAVWNQHKHTSCIAEKQLIFDWPEFYSVAIIPFISSSWEINPAKSKKQKEQRNKHACPESWSEYECPFKEHLITVFSDILNSIVFSKNVIGDRKPNNELATYQESHRDWKHNHDPLCILVPPQKLLNNQQLQTVVYHEFHETNQKQPKKSLRSIGNFIPVHF